MKTLDSPPVERFAPVKAYSALGVDCLRLRNPDDVLMDVTEVGALAIDQSPRIAALLGRMSEFIIEHDGYRSTAAVEDAESGHTHKTGSGKHEHHRSSVYRPDATPEAIVKAYNFERHAAPVQFYFGAWLQSELAWWSDTLSSPRQIALLTAPRSGHRTVVMERMPGTSLTEIGNDLAGNDNYGSEDIDGLINGVHLRVKAELGRLFGKKAMAEFNDLNLVNTSNIIVPTPMPGRPETMFEGPPKHHRSAVRR
jgi:hypothetical protein